MPIKNIYVYRFETSFEIEKLADIYGAFGSRLNHDGSSVINLLQHWLRVANINSYLFYFDWLFFSLECTICDSLVHLINLFSHVRELSMKVVAHALCFRHYSWNAIEYNKQITNRNDDIWRDICHIATRF